MVMIEGPLFGGGVVRVLPGLGNHHHQRVADVAARLHQQIERVVELLRVAAVRRDHRRQDARVRAPLLRTGQIGFLRPHPGEVALQRVDLAVVAHHAERLRALPGGEGVRAVALMEDRDGGLELRVAQIRIEVGQLRRDEEPFVDDGFGREGRNVEVGDALSPGALRWRACGRDRACARIRRQRQRCRRAGRR